MKQFWKRFSAIALALVVGIGLLCPAALAVRLPSLPASECVVDDAGVLSSSTTEYMNNLNSQLEESCSGAQIGVLTVQYTGTASTEEYALEAFNTWGIGSESENNGILILLVMESPLYEDGDYYLTYGDGFNNTDIDKQASALAQTMEDSFAARNYDKAVTTCADATAQLIAQYYGVSLSSGTDSSSGQKQSIFVTILNGIFIFILLGAMLVIMFSGVFGIFRRRPRPPRRPPRGPGAPPPPPPPRGGGRPPRAGGAPPRSGGGSFGGGGGGSFGGMGGGASHGGGGGRGR